jgi:DNA-binding IscR family transcriptional regulator
VVHDFWKSAQKGLVGVLSETKIADICRPKDADGGPRVRQAIPGA